MNTWKKMSFVAIGGVLPVYAAYCVVKHLNHHHSEGVRDYDYLDMHTRNSQHHRQFPWADKSATLFGRERHYIQGGEGAPAHH